MAARPDDTGRGRGLKFGPLTMLVALVIGLGAGVGVAAAVSSGDDKEASGFVDFNAIGNAFNATIAWILGGGKAADSGAVAKPDGEGGLEVKLATGEQVAPENNGYAFTKQGDGASAGVPTQGNLIGVGAGNLIGVGAGNVVEPSTPGQSFGPNDPANELIGVGAGHLIGVGAGHLSDQGPDSFARAEVVGLSVGGCTDPWLGKYIDERTKTGTTPDGGNDGICYPEYYGASPDNYFVDKSQYKEKVDKFFDRFCPDAWVTRAIIEVTGRWPVGPECETWRYGGSWNSYDELKAAVTRYGLLIRSGYPDPDRRAG